MTGPPRRAQPRECHPQIPFRRRCTEYSCSCVRGARWLTRYPLAQSSFPQSRVQIEPFRTRTSLRDLDDHLFRELWAGAVNFIPVRLTCECCDDSGQRRRTYGEENWRSGADRLMEQRLDGINEPTIAAPERDFPWRLGRRPDDRSSPRDLEL